MPSASAQAPSSRLLAMLLAAAAVALLASCATGEQPGQTEPVAPEMEATPYTEDPDLAKELGDAKPDDSTSAADDTVGELTDQPFDGSAPSPSADGDVTSPPDEAPVAEDGEPYGDAFEDGQPQYEPTPGGAPSVPPPATDDDMTSPPAATGNDSTAQNTPEAAPSGQTTRYVDAILLNVRSKPNARAPIVRRLLGGARVRVEIHGGWSKLRAGQWVRTRHLSKTPTRRVSRAEADKAWRNSKYRDSWKPAK